MDDIQKGNQITSAFEYIQEVFVECQRLFYKIDNLVAPEWKSIYGNLVTKNMSKSLRESDKWLIDALFRVYGNDKDKLVNKAVTIYFWGEDMVQPVITAGKIEYSDINKRDHFDLWNIWYIWGDVSEDNDYELNGKIYNFKSEECQHIKSAQVFSLPLISIKDDVTLTEKVINPLKSL